MKAPNKGNHPCPVLLEDGGDYSSECSLNLDIIGDPVTIDEGFRQKTLYPVRAVLTCPPLNQFVDSGSAKIVLMVEQMTMRKSFDYYDNFKLEITPYELRLGDNIEITPIVVANKQLTLSFDPAYMDEMYGYFSSQSFTIEKGQILAYGKTLEIKTNAYKGLSSILTLRAMKEEDLNHPFVLDLEGDKIVVNCNKEIVDNLDLLQSSKTNLSALINATIAYPAMQMIIQTMIQDQSSYKDHRWFAAIKNKIAEIRQKKGETPFAFEPDEFQPAAFGSLTDFVWELTSELLTDSQGQLMVVGFLKAGEYN